jgi:DNA polymerase-1
MHTPQLFLIDSFGFIFRAFHARARMSVVPMRTTEGVPTEAVYIFHNMLRKVIETYKPDYLAAIYESLGPTLREQEFAAYKANRPEVPQDLKDQIPLVRRMLEAMRVPVLEFAGYEADDVIGTISRRASALGVEVTIVSSDKDMLQLVGGKVRMLNPAKDNTIYDSEKVLEFMGVPPSLVADLLALKGDAVDNIPGAPGIGDKGAKDLVMKFGPVESLLDRAAEVEKRTYRESLLNHREQVLMSKRLATIETNVPIEWTLDALTSQPPDTEAMKQIYRELEFFSFLKAMEPDAVRKDDQSADYQTVDSLVDYIATLSKDAPLALAMFQDTLALCASPGVARASANRELPADRKFIAHDAKVLLSRLSPPPAIARDILLEAFLLTADPGGCTLEALSERLLLRKPGARAEHHADIVLQLAAMLEPQIDEQGFRQLYEEIDLPLVPVLARMEQTGIRVDPAQLQKLSKYMEIEIARLTGEIFGLAKHEFNINSPQQLGKVLFEEMAIAPPGRTVKGKAPSTAADILEQLSAEHEIAGKVLEYRGLTKLKNTYVDSLPALINPQTYRIHTTFNQTGSATGRFSSTNPNLQNIPVRTELGREIRAAFVPEAGWKLVVADYSQIELRLLAHASKDPVLVDAFRNGEDIHTRTASEVFGVPPMLVTPEMRRNAKAVNFGIVYGQTSYGLASSLGIPRAEADDYIKSYFKRYAGVKRWLDATIAEVRASGYALTLFGRRRPIPDMNSRNSNARGFAERTAVNTPLQGGAADMIKLAMVRVDAELARRGMRARMLLQVHDELVFEAPPEEVDDVRELAKRLMEGVRKLEVPLVVETGAGDNWKVAK